MKCNVGTTDRVIRIILGIVILAIGYAYQSWWGLIGLIPLITGAIGWCGLYSVFHISTVSKKQSS